MNKLFYARLAGSNVRKNASLFVPYLLTCTLTVAMFYLFHSLGANPGLQELRGGDTLWGIMQLGNGIVALFACIFLFYTNSFLAKRRKREFGLFNILGMEKRHLARLLLWETIYTACISLALGMGIGILLDKLMYMVITRMLGGGVALGFYISGAVMLDVVKLFAFIYTAIFLYSLLQMQTASPIQLLQSDRAGEREPRTRWLMALAGAICLGAGYYLALTTRSAIAVVNVFFVAVLLVIAGTYLLFIAGSIALLKMLRKNKKFYYQTSHFISISGMLYRMKQNAAGLANICILSTMVMVMISSTLSLMLGLNDAVKRYCSFDIVLDAPVTHTDPAVFEAALDQALAEEQAQPVHSAAYRYLSFAALRQGEGFSTDRSQATMLDLDKVCNLLFMPAADYTRATGIEVEVGSGQALIYSNRNPWEYDTLSVLGETFDIAGQLETVPGDKDVAADISPSYYLVVDEETLEQVYQKQQAAYGETASSITLCCGMDFDLDDSRQIDLAAALRDKLDSQGFAFSINSRARQLYDLRGMYGGLFFLGIFLGLLFTIAAVLIIYYKQLSEGYADKERFEILQKVGMSHAEVKGTIRSQILTVFFLPLLTAGVHIAFAYPFIARMLALLGLQNHLLFALCTLGSFGIFALLYALIYRLTAKTYYRIVSW